MLKNIKDNWQILTVICLLWSFFDIAFFYQAFGIEIQEYVSTNEIILLTLPGILKGVVIFGAILLWISLGHSTGRSQIYQDQGKIWQFRSLYRRLLQDIKLKKLLGIVISTIAFIMEIIGIGFCIFVLVITIYIVFYTHSIYKYVQPNHTWPVVVFAFLFGILPLLMKLNDYAEKPTRIVLKRVLFNNDPIFYFIISFILCSVIATEINHSMIKNGIGLKQVSLIRSGKRIETDSCLTYIGSTRNFIFFWDKKDNHSLIFNKNGIDSLLLNNFNE